jgi:menaquinone-dependent protoporphyrinogen IX oxidase
MTAKEKAKQLVNMYYSHSKTQLQAVEICEKVVLTTMCQQVDSLHGHLGDYDKALIVSSINQLKWQQEIAVELQRIKNKIPV